MTELEQKIIDTYENTKEIKEVTLSYGEIAKKVGCSKMTAYYTIKKYLRNGTIKNKKNKDR